MPRSDIRKGEAAHGNDRRIALPGRHGRRKSSETMRSILLMVLENMRFALRAMGPDAARFYVEAIGRLDLFALAFPALDPRGPSVD